MYTNIIQEIYIYTVCTSIIQELSHLWWYGTVLTLCDISTISELFLSSEKANNLYALEVYSVWSLQQFFFLDELQSTGHFYSNLYSLDFKQKMHTSRPTQSNKHRCTCDHCIPGVQKPFGWVRQSQITDKTCMDLDSICMRMHLDSHVIGTRSNARCLSCGIFFFSFIHLFILKAPLAA